MKNFKEKIDLELEKIFYTKDAADIEYNLGFKKGFNLGAKWSRLETSEDFINVLKELRELINKKEMNKADKCLKIIDEALNE